MPILIFMLLMFSVPSTASDIEDASLEIQLLTYSDDNLEKTERMSTLLMDLDGSYAQLNELKGPGINSLCDAIAYLQEAQISSNDNSLNETLNSLKSKLKIAINDYKYSYSLFSSCRQLLGLKFVCPRGEGKCSKEDGNQ
ncbi:hypothetical protein [Lacimicrobium sp. SS2-24]|uniref:hypothetical protein n=1 Tax=Lacimicrobium sp. SS2-24 TaxID=2005569 RepID=UPI00112FEF68|nr:hypothetical protein [Lacimicrobium sp. SS2-24]